MLLFPPCFPSRLNFNSLRQTKFQEAKTEMRNRKMLIDKVFQSSVSNAGGTLFSFRVLPELFFQVEQYRTLTIQNLQMTLYSEKQDAGSQVGLTWYKWLTFRKLK